MSKDFVIDNGVLTEYRGSDAHVVIPDSVTVIGAGAFIDCEILSSVIIPDSVTEICRFAFKRCTSLSSVVIPDSVTEICKYAFSGCTNLASIVIPDSVKKIGERAFENCTGLTSFTMPRFASAIEYRLFEGCTSLTSVVIPNSVTVIESGAFNYCTSLTIICGEGSYAHQFCIEHHIAFLFDYLYEAFHGLIPPGTEMLSSPFLADEKHPYVFISYSHKDRERVLPILKTLYEAGWGIWYDEGLTIGDHYDETLENHVRSCSAFLLFVTENSLNSLYINENEIPWAIEYNRPIIKCVLDNGEDYEISGGVVVGTVSQPEIEPALAKINGLKKREPRTAKGITVAVDPANRSESAGGGFAYCLYAPQSSATAKTILFDAKSGGCALYDAVENGEDKEKLQISASLIVFLDKAFLADKHLTNILTEAFTGGKDIAVCLLEDIEDDALPEGLAALSKMQWLNFAHGVTADLNKKLARHLQKRGCRDSSAIPGFDYEKTDEGIVIKKYTGTDSAPKLESEYGGVPVAAIAASAFENCKRLKSFIVPNGVRRIGDSAFRGCINLLSVGIPNSVKIIGESAFILCTSLSSFVIPDGVTEINGFTFSGCTNLASIVIPDSVTKIKHCAFNGCKSLTSVVIPNSVTIIDSSAFKGCTSLTSVVIPESVTEINFCAFSHCTSLTSVVIPNRLTRIDTYAFKYCSRLTVFCPRFSYAWKYCMKNKIPVKPYRLAKKQ